MELTKEEYSKKILQDSEKLVKDSALNLQETISSFIEEDLTENIEHNYDFQPTEVYKAEVKIIEKVIWKQLT